MSEIAHAARQRAERPFQESSNARGAYCWDSRLQWAPVDTTKFPNGQHQLKITVQDAAGNTAVVYDGTISISNLTAKTSSQGLSPEAQSSGVLSRGPANGTNASEQATLTARWTSTSKAHLTSSYGHPRSIEGQLTGPGGEPIEGALINLTATSAYASGQPTAMTGPRTGPNGRFQATLPRDISSRTLLLAYRSHLGDALPVATRTLTLAVPAALRLHISPRAASSTGTIRFSGRLLGEPIPAGGKQLVLEARAPGARWVEFHVIRAAARGHFGFLYRFRLPGPASYQFRVLCEQEADYPFIAGASNVIEVQER
jgi:hypothetical protein